LPNAAAIVYLCMYTICTYTHTSRVRTQEYVTSTAGVR
jgi:hypothetical protein